MWKRTLILIFIAVFSSGNLFACEGDKESLDNSFCNEGKCVTTQAEANENNCAISVALTGAARDGKAVSVPVGILSGVQVGPCNCWEPAMPGARQAGALCLSGAATAVGCPNSSCASGGKQWHFVCD